jgi:hypothetical protein
MNDLQSWYYGPCACEQIWASLVWQAQNFKMVAQNEYNALYWATTSFHYVMVLMRICMGFLPY